MVLTNEQLKEIVQLGYKLVKNEESYLKFTGDFYVDNGQVGKKSVELFFYYGCFYNSHSWVSYKSKIEVNASILSLQVNLNKVKEDEEKIKEIIVNEEE